MSGIPARSGLMALLMVMLMALAGCSTTVEAQQNRFKKNKDTIEVLAAKNPMMQRAVKEKLAGFQTEHDSIVAKGGTWTAIILVEGSSPPAATSATCVPWLVRNAAGLGPVLLKSIMPSFLSNSKSSSHVAFASVISPPKSSWPKGTYTVGG